MTQVFISYSRKDLVFVERLAEDLKAAGLEVWYDLSGLDGGTRWGREIQSAIQQSQIFVVVLSPNSIDSEWVEKEFMYANSLKRKIIPLLLKPCETPMWFINLHFIDVQGTNYDSHFWVILKAMGVKPGDMKAKEKPATAVSDILATPKAPIPLPDITPPEKKKSPRALKIRLAWIVALVGLAAVIALVIWGKPALAARLAPVPTPTPTATHTPDPTPTATATATATSTPTLTLEPSPTFTPTSTLNPTTGSVRGSIHWAYAPFEGVVVELCNNWLYTCKGDKYTGITGTNGNFLITEIPQGEYQLITKYPGQNDVTRALGQGGFPLSITVTAGQLLEIDQISICKFDLSLYKPTVMGHTVTFVWKAYPGATSYTVRIISKGGWDTTTTTYTVSLDSGSYQVQVQAIGKACSMAMVNFTVP
jgi:hypothetical protein